MVSTETSNKPIIVAESGTLIIPNGQVLDPFFEMISNQKEPH